MYREALNHKESPNCKEKDWIIQTNQNEKPLLFKTHFKENEKIVHMLREDTAAYVSNISPVYRAYY